MRERSLTSVMCWGRETVNQINLATLFTWLSLSLVLKMMKRLRADDRYPFRLLCHFRIGESRVQPLLLDIRRFVVAIQLLLWGLVCSSPAPRDFPSIGHQFVPGRKVKKTVDGSSPLCRGLFS